MATTFPEILSTEAGKILEPLKALNNAPALNRFVNELGFSYDGVLGGLSLGDLVTAVEGLIQKGDALAAAETDEEKLIALLELVDQATAVVVQLKAEIPNIKTALDNLSNLKGEDLLNFTKVFLRRAVDHLVYSYLEAYRAPIYAFLFLLKLADEVEDSESGLSYKHIAWENLGTLFTAPGDLFDAAYSWRTNFASAEFMERFEILLGALQIPGGIYPQSTTVQNSLGRNGETDPQEIRVPLYQAGVWGENWAEIDLNLSPIPADGGKKVGLFLYPYLMGGATISSDLSEDWEIELSGSADLGGGLGLEIRPEEKLKIVTDLFSAPLESVGMELKLTLRRKDESENVLLGNKVGTYLAASKFEVQVMASKQGSNSDFGVALQLGTMELVVAAGKEGDGFLAKVMPEGIRAEFDFGMGYSLSRGFYFDGGSGLSVYLPTLIKLGPLEILGLEIGFAPGPRSLELALGADVKLALGPFVATVEGMGLTAGVEFPEEGGRFGPFDLAFGFKPPTGIGLSIDAGVIKGAGYLDIDAANGRYVGMAELSIKELISLKAIGILNTQMPDGSKGFALLLLVTAEFSPMPLGFGFTLNGVGGLVAVNRTMLLDVMREGVRTGALDSILFPDDPVANASRIVSDLEAIFPIDEGRFVFGPMGIIGWGAPSTASLVTLEMGLLIEVPNPIRLAILGILKMALPDEDLPLLILQVAFLGTIDFEQKYLSFDASIFDSRILTFTLEGDMIVRLTWGDDPNFLFSVGGFHPAYTPPPLDIPDMTRLTLNLLTGNNPRLTLSAYFALTSNTVQVGARAELYIRVAKVFGKKLFVEGFLGFDALFQFSPFYFIVSVEAGLSVIYGSKALLSIYLGGSLEGPTPWRVQGRAEFKVLGIKFKVRVDKTFGQSEQTTLPNKAVEPLLVEALADPRNWTPELPNAHGGTVTVKEIDVPEGELLADPVSGLGVNQKILPTGVKISKFGNYGVKDATPKFSLSLHDAAGNVLDSEPLTEQFAPAQFFEKKEAERISGKSFEKMNSGLIGKAGASLSGSHFLERKVQYEETIYDGGQVVKKEEKKGLTKLKFQQQLRGAAVARSAMATSFGKKASPQKVRLVPATYVLSSRGDQSMYAEGETSSAIEAALLLKQNQDLTPQIQAHVQVLPRTELQPLS